MNIAENINHWFQNVVQTNKIKQFHVKHGQKPQADIHVLQRNSEPIVSSSLKARYTLPVHKHWGHENSSLQMNIFKLKFNISKCVSLSE